MKQIYIFLVCLFASISMNAQEVKLEWVNSLEDAEKCYDDIKSFWYKDGLKLKLKMRMKFLILTFY